METFPIQRARQELGFTPATSVRTDIQVPTDTSGAALGQALVKGIEIYKRKQQMDDTLARDEAIKIRSNANDEINLFRAQNADTRLWTPHAKSIMENAVAKTSTVKSSARMKNIIKTETDLWYSKQGTRFLIKEIEQKKQDTTTVMVDDIVEAFRINDPERKVAALLNFDNQATSIYSPDEARIIRRNAVTAGYKSYFKDRAGKDAEGTITLLGNEIEARKNNKGKIPEEIMTNSELRSSINIAQEVQKESQVAFENSLNGALINIDNTPNLSQSDFDTQSELLKQNILAANIPNTRKRKLLTNLEKWRRGDNEIDYAKILSLNQEMDAAQRSGIVDPTIQTRIMRASLEGAFGGRNKGGQKTYGDMIRRFSKLQFDERLQAIAPIIREVEQYYLAGDSRLLFLFNEAKNKLIAEHPEWDTRELFIQIEALGAAYEVLSESAIEEKLRSKGEQVIQMTSPDGIKYIVPIEKKQKFIDNGYTE